MVAAAGAVDDVAGKLKLRAVADAAAVAPPNTPAAVAAPEAASDAALAGAGVAKPAAKEAAAGKGGRGG